MELINGHQASNGNGVLDPNQINLADATGGGEALNGGSINGNVEVDTSFVARGGLLKNNVPMNKLPANSLAKNMFGKKGLKALAEMKE